MKSPPFWVLDTNVIVSGALTPSGTCGQVLDLVRAQRIRPVWTPEILAEYMDVLTRPKFGISQPAAANLVSMFGMEWLVTPTPAPSGLPDPDDAKFLAAALGTTERTLVTGNLKHYPAAKRQGVRVLTPREALDAL